MTVSYTAEIATCRKFGFLKLLFRWKGSVYKLVWVDLLTFLILYYLLNCVYRFVLDESEKRAFESLVHYCKHYGTLIPLSFVLGFYVSIVMQRWWDQYIVIPWPDPVAVFISVHVHGLDERGRVMRRTVMRYVCLCLTMVLTMISPRVKKRFPTMDNFVEAGLLLENEKNIIERIDVAYPNHPKHWMPIVWAASIITRARKEGRIRDDFAVKTIIDELNKFRGKCGVLMYFDDISIPLVYTQVVTLAVYSYFLCSVISYQWTDRKNEKGYINYIDCYFPIFSMLQFFFYMGWLKVAESMINPFGEDDDDFEVNWIIDRNLQVSYLIVDEMHHEHPELVRDQYWDDIFPNELPYPNEADIKREEPPEASTARLVINPNISSARLTSQAQLQNGKSNHSIHVSHLNVDELLPPNGKMRETPGSIASLELSRISSTTNAKTSKSITTDPSVKTSGNVRIKEDSILESHESDSNTEQPSIPHAALPKIQELFRQERSSLRVASTSSTQNVSIKSDYEDGEDDDDFERLKVQREKERSERQRLWLARQIAEIRNRTIDSDTSPGTSRRQVNLLSSSPSQNTSRASLDEREQEEAQKLNREEDSEGNKEEKS